MNKRKEERKEAVNERKEEGKEEVNESPGYI